MARRQTALVRDRLVAAHPELAANGAVEIVTIRPTGDRVQDRLLAEIGGNGLFVKVIEEALIARHIDLAVHPAAGGFPLAVPRALFRQRSVMQWRARFAAARIGRRPGRSSA
jgi:hydroxymethylbilane synthase